MEIQIAFTFAREKHPQKIAQFHNAVSEFQKKSKFQHASWDQLGNKTSSCKKTLGVWQYQFQSLIGCGPLACCHASLHSCYGYSWFSLAVSGSVSLNGALGALAYYCAKMFLGTSGYLVSLVQFMSFRLCFSGSWPWPGSLSFSALPSMSMCYQLLPSGPPVSVSVTLWPLLSSWPSSPSSFYCC